MERQLIFPPVNFAFNEKGICQVSKLGPIQYSMVLMRPLLLVVISGAVGFWCCWCWWFLVLVAGKKVRM